jgi:hypothetical protein
LLIILNFILKIKDIFKKTPLHGGVYSATDAVLSEVEGGHRGHREIIYYSDTDTYGIN